MMEKASPKNAISVFEEYGVQKQLKPKIEIVTNTGPSHQPTFVAEAKLGPEVYGTGTGNSKQEARVKAAEMALQKLNLQANHKNEIEEEMEQPDDIVNPVPNKDPVAALQEYGQLTKQEVEYSQKKEGPSHMPVFTVTAKLGDETFPQGKSSNSKDAKKKAACMALQKLKLDGKLPSRFVDKEVTAIGQQGKETQQKIEQKDDNQIANKDVVTMLKEYGDSVKQKVDYILISQQGPANLPIFTMSAKLGDETFPEAKSKSVKDAKKKAACLALQKLKLLPYFPDTEGGTSEISPADESCEPTNNEETIKFFLEVFMSYIIQELKHTWKDITAYHIDDASVRQQFRSIAANDPVEALKYLLEYIICDPNNTVGRFANLVEVFEEAGHEKIVRILQDYTIPKHHSSKYKSLLQQHLEIMLEKLPLLTILHNCTISNIISKDEAQHLKALSDSDGNNFAVLTFLLLLPSRELEWYHKFMNVLMMCQLDDLVQTIDKSYYEDVKKTPRPAVDDVPAVDKAPADCNLSEVDKICGDDQENNRSKGLADKILDDTYCMRLYRETLEKDKEKIQSVHVKILGCSGQGKSSLVEHLLKQQFANDAESSNVIEVCVNKVNIPNESAIKSIDEDVNKCVQRLVAVVTSKNNNIASAKVAATDLIAEPKTDKRNEDITANINTKIKDKEIYSLFASELKRKCNEIASSTGNCEKASKMKLSFWDFEGHFTFYSTHQIFHSREAIYLLVFDLSKPFSERIFDEESQEYKTMEYYVRFWINSIHSFVGTNDGREPSIILVGTHKDKCKDPVAYFTEIRKLFRGTTVLYHLHPENIAVDNIVEEDEGLKLLGRVISKLAEEKAHTIENPAKWILMDMSLLKLRHKKIVTFKEVLNADCESEIPIENEEQIKQYLKYHHLQGNLLYFDEDRFCDYVFLDTQFVVDSFKCLIATESLRMQNAELVEWWDKLYVNAELHPALLQKIWVNNFKDNMDLLLMILEKYQVIERVHITERAPNINSENKKCENPKNAVFYIVPSFLKHDVNGIVGNFQDAMPVKTEVSLVYRLVNSTILPTVYQRITAAAVGRWPVFIDKESYLLFKDMGVYELSNFQVGIIRVIDNDLYLLVVRRSLGAIDQVECDDFRRWVETITEQEFKKFNNGKDPSGLCFQIYIRCNHKYAIKSSNLKLLADVVDSSLPCEHHMTISVSKGKQEWFQNENIAQMPSVKLDEKCLMEFAKNIGVNWKILAFELGISDEEVFHIMEDQRTAVGQIYQVLLKWKSASEVPVTIADLIKILQNVQNVGINWSAIWFYVNKLVQKNKTT